MSFKDMIKTDAQNVILNTGEFATSIVYTPFGAQSRTIKAIIEFKDPETIEEDFGRVIHRFAEIEVLNDGTSGIGSFNRTGDRITLNDQGGIERTAMIMKIISSDYALQKFLIGW